MQQHSNLPRLFASVAPHWGEGSAELEGIGRVPSYGAIDWLSDALRKARRGATAAWTRIMARACCEVFAGLESGTTPEEMIEHLPEALHDRWTRYPELAAWISGDPARAFEQLDRLRDEYPGAGSAEMAELAIHREATSLGIALVHAAEREWRVRACES